MPVHLRSCRQDLVFSAGLLRCNKQIDSAFLSRSNVGTIHCVRHCEQDQDCQIVLLYPTFWHSCGRKTNGGISHRLSRISNTAALGYQKSSTCLLDRVWDTFPSARTTIQVRIVPKVNRSKDTQGRTSSRAPSPQSQDCRQRLPFYSFPACSSDGFWNRQSTSAKAELNIGCVSLILTLPSLR